jgi:PRTRC genetic system protein C
MQTSAITRKFLFNGTPLPDPNPAVNIEQARDILSASHPELATAAIDGPKVNGSEHTYTFIKSVGTKG